MREETLLTAAQRILRFLAVDDANGGGLLSRETLIAAEQLRREVLREERRLKREDDRARMPSGPGMEV